MTKKLQFLFIMVFSFSALGCNENEQYASVEQKIVDGTMKKIVLYEKPHLQSLPYKRGLKSGYVKIGFDINEQGKAVNVSILDSLPKRMFDQSVLKSVKKMKFLNRKEEMFDQHLLIYNYDPLNGLSIY